MADNSTEPKKASGIAVETDEDEMEGYITIHTSEISREPTLEEAQQTIKNAGIVYGIKEKELADIFEKQVYNMKICIAEGIPVTDGKDAEIKYFFNVSDTGKPKVMEDGTVDFKDISLIQNVREGEVLAELIPPEEGKKGMTVTGKEILPKEGKPAQLPKGKNTEISPDDPNKLIASIGGNVSLKGKLVEVNPVFTINGNIDFSTGNVKYIGVLTIKGDVKSGFSVLADEDITVEGVVEDATVESKKNVILKTGFIGRGEGKIIAGGSVYLKYAENQTIKAEGDIIVSESLRHCKVECGGKVIAMGQTGVVVGGRIVALKGVEAKILGSPQNTKTDVEAGLTGEMQRKLSEMQANLKTNKENMNKVTKAIGILQNIKTLKKELPEDKATLLAKLQTLLAKLKKQKLELNKTKSELDSEIEKHRNVTIAIHNIIYPGVKISILNINKYINDRMDDTTFRLFENEIITVTNKEASEKGNQGV